MKKEKVDDRDVIMYVTQKQLKMLDQAINAKLDVSRKLIRRAIQDASPTRVKMERHFENNWLELSEKINRGINGGGGN